MRRNIVKGSDDDDTADSWSDNDDNSSHSSEAISNPKHIQNLAAKGSGEFSKLIKIVSEDANSL